MGIDLGQTLANLTEANNLNVAALEESIRSTAWLSFVLNGVSCFAASLGFIAQFGQYRHDQRSASQREHCDSEQEGDPGEEGGQRPEGSAQHGNGGETESNTRLYPPPHDTPRN